MATGKVTDRCYERHGKAEFLDFLKRVAKASQHPQRQQGDAAGGPVPRPH